MSLLYLRLDITIGKKRLQLMLLSKKKHSMNNFLETKIYACDVDVDMQDKEEAESQGKS